MEQAERGGENMDAKKATQHDLSEHERELRAMKLEAQVYEYKAKYYEALAACMRSQIEGMYDPKCNMKV